MRKYEVMQNSLSDYAMPSFSRVIVYTDQFESSIRMHWILPGWKSDFWALYKYFDVTLAAYVNRRTARW